MAQIPNSRSTPTVSLISLLILHLTAVTVNAVNITGVLSSFPEFSHFNSLLSSSPVAAELAARSSVTLLAVPNSFFLKPSLAADLLSSSSSSAADVIRYHVLLEYLSWPDLHLIPLVGGKLITTLYQTTGRAPANLGSLNLTRSPSDVITAFSTSSSSSDNATFVSLLKTLPYNLSIFAVDSLLLPYGFDLAASSDAKPALWGLNITQVLVDGKDFNVAAAMLEASGVVQEFEAD